MLARTKLIPVLTLGLFWISTAWALPDSPTLTCLDAHPGCFPKTESAHWVKERGLLTTVMDPQGNHLYMVFPSSPDHVLGRYIYQTYLRGGLGSTPVGLDRSQSGPSQIVAFEKHGSQLVVRIENSAFIATDKAQAQSVRESFADSVVFQTPIAEVAQDGSILVDLQKWLSRDAFGVIDRLREARQGDFKIDDRLNIIDPESVKAFPNNVEIDISQTFLSDKPGSEVSGIVPDRHAMTLILHHSLIRLPDPGFEPLEADPRTGAISSAVADYSQPLSEPVIRHLAHHFRLEKIDPNAERSKVVKPIVFYVDRQAPVQIQKDLIEGASWWAKAFEAAGFIDAFKVELLPEGVSVLDARYNVINWVHRQTRGWSYGENVIDPRTGEIVRGAVLLGSLRARQDRMIFEGLLGASHTGTGDAQDPLILVDQRLRQLATHETGHAIGLEHNFISSTYDDRASVMDYPPPRVTVKNNQLDVSDAYKVGIGSWDLFAIHWLYGQPQPHQDARSIRRQWVTDAYQKGQRFVADSDARPIGSGLANGALWDDGTNPIDGLNRALQVRRIALDQFGKDNLRPGAPLYELRRLIVPIYLYHRYEVEAASKWVGGAYVNYAINGDGLMASQPVSGVDQHRALKAIEGSLSISALDLRPTQIELLSAGEGDSRHVDTTIELFESNTQPQFDLESSVGAAADEVFNALWATPRLNRVALQSESLLTTRELLREPIQYVLSQKSASPHARLITETVIGHAVNALTKRLNDQDLSLRVRTEILQALNDLPKELKQSALVSPAFANYWQHALRPDGIALNSKSFEHSTAIPPGMPIGSASTADSGWWDFED